MPHALISPSQFDSLTDEQKVWYAQILALLNDIITLEQRMAGILWTPKHLREQRMEAWTKGKAAKVEEYNRLADLFNASVRSVPQPA